MNEIGELGDHEGRKSDMQAMRGKGMGRRG
jgi:hypothetical protein